MPANSTANLNPRTGSRSKRASPQIKNTDDPVDPMNQGRPLATLLEDEPVDRWRQDFDISGPEKTHRFWDTKSIVAASVSFALGTGLGVPIGHYLYYVWF